MEAQTCRARGIDSVAFLDPIKENQNTWKEINANPHDLIKDLT